MGPDLLVRQHSQAICWQIHLWSGSWYVELISVCPSFSDYVSCWGCIVSVTEEWIESTGIIIVTGENRRSQHSCPSATLSATNPMWTDPWSNPVTAERSWQLIIQPVKLMRFEVSLQVSEEPPVPSFRVSAWTVEMWMEHTWETMNDDEKDRQWLSSCGLLYTLGWLR